jgi:2-polyprenyl-6-methoxyphenol hydroxylase-like FAD-dependent oxidoreductase
MSDMLHSVLIVGGGIAGCSTAIALAADGHKVRVIEKQTAWQFQSSGIFVYSNGLASLRDLGVLDDIINGGFAVPDGRNLYFEDNGAPITEVTYPAADNGSIPAIVGIKRAELHRVLATRMESLDVSVSLGVTVLALEQTSESVTVGLSDGTNGSYDIVIGADGLRSQLRTMIGIDTEPTYTGFGVWRSVHSRPANLTDKIMMMGHGKRFGIMPISDDKLYTFGTIAEPQDQYYEPNDWPRLMHERFAEFQKPAAQFINELGPDTETMFTAVEEVILPLPWHRGRVQLIGDSAHASTPFMGQGGAMAMQDAVVLARLLRRTEICEALEQFGNLRQPMCQFVQNVSRSVGEAGASENTKSLTLRSERMRTEAQNGVDQFYARMSEFNTETATKTEPVRENKVAC